MDKSTDISEHPSSFAVSMSNDKDVYAKMEYFKTPDEANAHFDMAVGEYDNVYLYKLLRCSEVREG